MLIRLLFSVLAVSLRQALCESRTRRVDQRSVPTYTQAKRYGDTARTKNSNALYLILLMKWLLVLLSIFIVSCSSNKKRYFTGDIEFTCTSKGYFDTLSTFLLTNDKSDLGGTGSGLASLFSADRV